MTDRLSGALGLCMKAGKCKSGDVACETLVRGGQAKLVALDSAASENTKKKYTDMCHSHDVPLIFVENMGKAIGKDSRKVMAVTDENFKRLILNAQVF
ncbi:MAG TPA: ribosomal L7Ae/L30e/S12e/Gadd45 family protein [Clostridia bacterium]|nr:ribosomal L7Ae/L30e/S12e/Gadd45 family protein [Clostridia bacterium]